MLTVISALLTSLGSIWRTRAALQLEILALRHQIGVLQRGSRMRASTETTPRPTEESPKRQHGSERVRHDLRAARHARPTFFVQASLQRSNPEPEHRASQALAGRAVETPERAT